MIAFILLIVSLSLWGAARGAGKNKRKPDDDWFI